MSGNESPAGVRTLRRLLATRNQGAFLEAFRSASDLGVPRNNEYLRALAGEGLCMLLAEESDPSPQFLGRYAELLREGFISAPATAVRAVGAWLRADDLLDLAEQLSLREQPTSPRKIHSVADIKESADQRPILRVKRVIQAIQMSLGDSAAADVLGIRRSVFRSQQERSFLRALSLRFPALLALPNYPLDQIANFDRLRTSIDKKTWVYGVRCRVDAVLVIPDEGDPIAAFELDSNFHDNPAATRRDHMKNRLFEVIGLPFFRLRVESPESMSTDEWYALLTDEVAPALDLGRRIRCRTMNYSLVPA